MGNGKVLIVMAMVSRFGLMALSMRAIGKRVKLVDRENSLILTVIFIMVTGNMIRLMVSACTPIAMAVNIPEIGKTIYHTVSVLRLGLTTPNILVYTILVASTILACTYGRMAQNTQVAGMRIKYRELEFMSGLMAVPTTENGSKITWKELEFTNGSMVDHILEST